MNSLDALFQGLKDFCDAGDRTTPPVFVGREKELSRLNDVVAALARGVVEGQTTLVLGVPGCGKTALMNHWRETRSQDSNVVVTTLGARALDIEPRRVVEAITESVPSKIDNLRRLVADNALVDGVIDASRKTIRSVVGAFTRRSFQERLDMALNLTPETPFGTCLRRYAEHVWSDGVTVAVCIDEAQELPNTDRVKEILLTMYLGQQGVPIALFAFGTPRSEDTLIDRLGSDRLGAGKKISLGRLDSGEGRYALAKSLERYGLTTEDERWLSYLASRNVSVHDWSQWRRKLVERLAEDAQEFPHHVNNALRGLFEMLLANRDGFRNSEALRSEALARSQEYRDEYYKGRLRRVRDHSLALGAIASSLANKQKPLMKKDALDILQVSDDLGRAVSFQQAGDVLDKSLYSGVFSAEDRQLTVPIPSMRDHLAALYYEGIENGEEAAIRLRAASGIDAAS